MKISVLLPTRNGGALLGPCVESVLRQTDPDIELVVSDNANSDETPSVLAAYASDRRLKVVRQQSVLSVTDNWNAAYAASSGDYLVVIGDDDYLLPDYFARLRQLLDSFGRPSCLTHSAYSFLFPATIPGVHCGHFASPHFEISPQLLREGRLSKKTRAAIVADMFRFRPRLPLNLQCTVFDRASAVRLPDGLFKAPFPDHYALNGLLMTAASWACAADQLLIIGVSPKSFGRYILSGEAERGFQYLGRGAEVAGALPGNELLTAMYQWLLLLQEDFPQARDFRISRGDYVVRQLWDWLRAWRLGFISAHAAIQRLCQLDGRDWLAVLRLLGDGEVRALSRGRLMLRRADRTKHVHVGLRPAPAGVRTHAEFTVFVAGLRAHGAGGAAMRVP